MSRKPIYTRPPLRTQNDLDRAAQIIEEVVNELVDEHGARLVLAHPYVIGADAAAALRSEGLL